MKRGEPQAGAELRVDQVLSSPGRGAATRRQRRPHPNLAAVVWVAADRRPRTSVVMKRSKLAGSERKVNFWLSAAASSLKNASQRARAT